MERFGGRAAVITGAASGIGRALCMTLAGRGVDIAAADINEAGLEETAESVRKLGRRVTTHVVDVADRAKMEAFSNEVAEQHEQIHILINNAGVSVAADFEDHSLDDFEWLIGINLWGVIHGCKFFLPQLKRADEAYIVNLSSMFGLIGVPGQTSYCSSKFAVRGFTEALAAELADSSIRLMSVHPGGVSTNIAASSRWSEARPPAEREKVLEFFANKAMPADKAAKLIVGAMEEDKRRLLIAPEAYLTDAFRRVFPSLPSSFMRKAQDLFMRFGGSK